MRLRGHDEHFASLLSKLFLTKNIPVNDPVYAEHTLSCEKVSQMVFLALNDLPAPRSILCTSESYFSNEEAILSRVSFPCVVKSSGSKGKLVWEVKTKEKLKKLLFRHGGLMLIQEYIPNTFDIRVLTYKDDVLGAIKRSSGDGFYNNVSKGGTTGNIELTEDEKELALASAKACGVDFAGVDIIRSKHGPLILEVNNGPQIAGFEKQTGINIPSEVAKRMAAT
jgi:ribosomal protein S6--L-glutamate ligase